MITKRKLRTKEEIDLIMLGFLYKMKSAERIEIYNACIMGHGTITPCLERLHDGMLVKFTETMNNEQKIKVWELTEKGEKRFLESLSSDKSTRLMLQYMFEHKKAQEEDIRKALLLEIDDRVIYFTIEKFCKQKLLEKIGEEYTLNEKGKEAYLQSRGYMDKDTREHAFDFSNEKASN